MSDALTVDIALRTEGANFTKAQVRLEYWAAGYLRSAITLILMTQL
jgi:hypothetical protein